jgi:DNA-binding NtrC family response regulator
MTTAIDTPQTSSYTSTTPRRILVVDGDTTPALVTQRGVQVMLGDAATVTIASSPGVAWLACVRDRVDLVVVDPRPEDRGAWALVKALHEERPEIPVFVLTAYDTPRLRMEMRVLGVRQYLAKPATLQEIARGCRRALGLEAALESRS